MATDDEGAVAEFIRSKGITRSPFTDVSLAAGRKERGHRCSASRGDGRTLSLELQRCRSLTAACSLRCQTQERRRAETLAKRTRYIGTFPTPEEAALARDVVAKQIGGRKLNFPDPEPQAATTDAAGYDASSSSMTG